MSNGTIRHVAPENGKTFTLEELQQHVGGYVEVLPAKHLTEGCMVLVDEEGSIKSPLPQINVTVSVWLQHHLYSKNVIRGNALILTPLEMGD